MRATGVRAETETPVRVGEGPRWLADALRPMRSKADRFPPALATFAERAKALSHPARLAILQLLARRNACICGEVVGGLPLAQATVSQHLRALREAGFISGRVEGPRSCYLLEWEALDEFERAFTELMAGLRAARAAAKSEEGRNDGDG